MFYKNENSMKRYNILLFLPIYFNVIFCRIYDEKPLVIGICSYNNKKWCNKNLDSVFNQNYENYRVIYVDDCSEDGTADAVVQYVAENNQTHRFTLIKNEERRRAMANHYTIIHSCKDEEIIVSLDGDDYFAHQDVLKTINRYYQSEAVWIAYSQFRRAPSGRLGYSRKMPDSVIKKQAYRSYDWIWGQTRTYYAWLAKKIKLKDLVFCQQGEFGGKFLPSSCDVALMLPMLEMAHGHCAFMDEILYIYNMHEFTDYRTNGTLQGDCNWYVRQQPNYIPLDDAFKEDKSLPLIDIITLKSDEYTKPLEIISNADSAHIMDVASYLEKAAIEIINESPAQYLFITNTYLPEESKLSDGVALLEQTGAQCVYFNNPFLDNRIPPCDYFWYKEKKIFFWHDTMRRPFHMFSHNNVLIAKSHIFKKCDEKDASEINLNEILNATVNNVKLFFIDKNEQ